MVYFVNMSNSGLNAFSYIINTITFNEIYFRVLDSTGFLAYVQGVPAIVGLTIGLTILCFLLCFMFRLFARGQWPRSRGYADANIPPTIILEGTILTYFMQ